MKITAWEILTLPDGGDSMMLLVVDTDEGVHGIGEVGIRSRQKAVAGGIEHLGSLLIGQDPSRIEHLWQLMARRGFFPADRIMSSAIAAFDVALWDIKGKSLGVPVFELLGGRVRDWVPAYTHVGDNSHDRDAYFARCASLAAEGWRYLRLAVPHQVDGILDQRRALRESIELFHSTREAVGDDVELILDVHTRLDPVEALTLCREIESARPYFVEDPLRSENLESYRRLRDRTAVPLAAGEQFASKWEFRRLIEPELIDYARVDVGVAGGLTEARKIAGMAESHAVKLATHNPLGPVTAASSLHLNAATSNIAIQEHQTDPDDLLKSLFIERPRISAGRIEIPTSPGLGVDIDRAAARACSARYDDRPALATEDGAFTNW
ncbi:galactonate dehydratase [Luethyella okanaganae]|uniref:Galactonate dehydratase n=1 Tax=Luethyella okanaganae TaxID=69372 RepID=A0ABW1VFU0_9MICO